MTTWILYGLLIVSVPEQHKNWVSVSMSTHPVNIAFHTYPECVKARDALNRAFGQKGYVVCYRTTATWERP